MSTEQKQRFISTWLPALIALLAYAAMWGALQNEVGNLKAADAAIKSELMPMTERLHVWVPRTEHDLQFQQLREQIAELKEIVRDTNRKMDSLVPPGKVASQSASE